MVLACHDKGDDFHEEARSINGRDAGFPEHRWLCAVRRQRQSPAASRYQRLSKRLGDRLVPTPFTFGALVSAIFADRRPGQSAVMPNRADECRQRADECRRNAAQVADDVLRGTYLDLARRWRMMAHQAESPEQKEETKKQVGWL
jgi:hypothetical protein